MSKIEAIAEAALSAFLIAAPAYIAFDRDARNIFITGTTTMAAKVPEILCDTANTASIILPAEIQLKKEECLKGFGYNIPAP